MSSKVFDPIYGAQRVLTVYDDHIELEQIQNFRSFLTNDFFNGDKDIFYCDMISCQFKESTSLILGYLQFETPGQYNRNNFGSENSFTFYEKDNEQVYKIYQYVRTRIREVKSGVQYKTIKEEPVETNSDLDELLKMKKLLDENIITQEEFDKFKKQVLKETPQETVVENVENIPKYKWECECGLVNEANATECEYCGRPRKC